MTISIKGDKIFIFIAVSVFLFDESKKLISVPGAAGEYGNHISKGSLTSELQNSDRYTLDIEDKDDDIEYGE